MEKMLEKFVRKAQHGPSKLCPCPNVMRARKSASCNLLRNSQLEKHAVAAAERQNKEFKKAGGTFPFTGASYSCGLAVGNWKPDWQPQSTTTWVWKILEGDSPFANVCVYIYIFVSKIRVHVDTCPIEHGPWPYAVLHAGLGKLVPGPFCSAGGEEETQKERQEEGHICSASLSLSIRDIRKPPQNELNRHFRLVLKPTVEILAEHYRTCLDKKRVIALKTTF